MKPFKEAEGFADDLQAAYDYYKSYSNASAKRFLAGYAEAVEIIQRSPFICRPRRHGWRQMIIQDYPSYSIFYKELPECWLLAGVVFVLRDPDVIQARLLIREISDS